MIRAKTLHGCPVIDVDLGKTIGTLAEIVLDPPGQRIAGLVVTPRRALFGSWQQLSLPASVIHTLKPGAVLVRRCDDAEPERWQPGDRPRLSQLVGRTVVSWSATVLGVLDDVLVDGADGRILGYPLRAAHFLEALERWLAGDSPARRWDYLPADAGLCVDYTLVRVPDDVVMRGRIEVGPETGVSTLQARDHGQVA
jgi:sporulation protein YlmC with PRC-barrel domain